MNLTLPLQDLVARLAIATGASAETASQFIREYFALIADNLARGERVTVAGLGSFAPDELRPGQVIFEPDPELAAAINQPFDCFEPVELPDNDDVTPAPDPVTLPPLPATQSPAPQPQPVPTPEPTPAPIPQPQPEPAPEPEPVTAPAEDADVQSAPAEILPAEVRLPDRPIDVNVAPSPIQVEIMNSEHIHRRPRAGIALLIGLILGGIIGYLLCRAFIHPSIGIIGGSDGPTAIYVADSSNDSPSVSIVAADTVAIPVPTEAADSIVVAPEAAPAAKTIVTDTVRPGRFLTSMSRTHYGTYEFWVYIYEENADKLSHPDRVPVGTVVTIPDTARYGINPNSPESLRRARLKAREIYARFPD